MSKKISYLIYKFLLFIDLFLKKTIKRSFLIFFKEFLEGDAYKTIFICNKKINFFVPNEITKWRVSTYFQKEPETFDWIDNFLSKEKIIFWDIGANIGLYSIYAALRFDNIKVISFEPSTSNLRILSRNISVNNLHEKIKINQFPLTEKENKYLLMRESEFIEGWSMNTFGENVNFQGGKINSKNNYEIYGTSINYLLNSKILEIPNYIKIDVDGIEHLILRGGSEYLQNKKIKSLSIELNEDFKKQYDEVFEIMKNSNFKFKHKKHAQEFYLNKKFQNTYNFVFEKNYE